MIRIRQVKVALDCEDKLCDIVAKRLKIASSNILEVHIQKKSLDARRKNDIHYVYEVDVKVKEEGRILKKVFSTQLFQSFIPCWIQLIWMPQELQRSRPSRFWSSQARI